MGLDIYLYKYKNFEETRRKEKLYDKFSEEIWDKEPGEYEDISEERKEAIRKSNKEYALSLGLSEDGSDSGGYERIEIDHPDYPDHYCKIGYFRSSYNEGGINRILGNMGLPVLGELFEVDKDEYYIKPDWQKALSNIENLIEKFREKPAYRVRAVYPETFGRECPKSEAEALESFQEEIDKTGGSCNYNYSNGKGEFSFHEPQKVLAMIPGQSRYIFNDRPCVFVVTESDNTWYLQALEIMAETCRFVLAKEDKEQYYLHWSG